MVGLMKISSPAQPVPQLPQLPANTPPPPVIQNSPVGSKPQAKSMTPSFLGSSAVPSAMNKGDKTLIGR